MEAWRGVGARPASARRGARPVTDATDARDAAPSSARRSPRSTRASTGSTCRSAPRPSSCGRRGPSYATDDDGIPRWTVLPDAGRIILYRLPIERLSHLHRDDELHRRMLVEGAVFRAAAEYLDRDPWDLGPERFRYF